MQTVSVGLSLHRPEMIPLISGAKFFAEGHKPDNLTKDSIRFYVYRTERAATGALLA